MTQMKELRTAMSWECHILPLPIAATDLNSKATWFG
jgi:hypothetical protein